jgi:hypothetical protein
LCWSGERYATGCCHQTISVFQRQLMLTSRSPTVRARIGRALFQGFLLGTMFFQLDRSQSAANNRFGALFISLSAIVMGSVSTIPELYSQRRVFYQVNFLNIFLLFLFIYFFFYFLSLKMMTDNI